uniref:Ribosomal protein L37 n=1 Tax=Cryptocaryon irritans TaxID=153251 RepID=R9QVQ5_9CILI|nr:ribosomal protein L37 [Cryptocaryon irritans]
MVKGKGTPHFGKKHQRTHTECRRCGRVSYHKQKKSCAACGFPSARLRRFDGWALKVRGRKGQGTGRMKYMKDIPRKAKNGFRSGTKPKDKVRKQK